MARLIDAEKFLSSMIKRFKCVPLIGRNDYDCESLKQMLNEAPTVDAVEVVRCKDCKYMYERMSVCTKVKVRGEILHIRVEPDDFCSCGERRTDD